MSVFGAGLAAPTDPSDWDWVAPRLGDASTVSSLVPTGFARYARIDHGTEPVASSSELPAELLPRLVRFLGALTTTPDHACFGIWEGYGWNDQHLAASRSDSSPRWWRRAPTDPFADATDSLDETRAALDAELLSLPAIPAGDRQYRVLSGPLHAVLEMHDPIAVWARRVPELWWPADRAWFVGSDADLACTYVAGRWELVDVLLEGWADRVCEVAPTDRVDHLRELDQPEA